MGCPQSKPKDLALTDLNSQASEMSTTVKTVDPRLPFDSYRQLFNLKNTWKAVTRKMDATAKHNLQLFLEKHPEHLGLHKDLSKFTDTEKLLESTAFENAANAIFGTFDFVMENLEKNVDGALKHLTLTGRIHAKIKGFRAEYFHDMKDPFLASVKEALGDRFTEAAEENITRLWNFCVQQMLEQIPQQPADEGAKKATEPAAPEQAAGKEADQSAEQAADKQADQSAEEAAEKGGDQLAPEQTGEQAPHKTTEEESLAEEDKAKQQGTEASEETTEQPPEKDKAEEQADEPPSQQTGEKTQEVGDKSPQQNEEKAQETEKEQLQKVQQAPEQEEKMPSEQQDKQTEEAEEKNETEKVPNDDATEQTPKETVEQKTQQEAEKIQNEQKHVEEQVQEQVREPQKAAEQTPQQENEQQQAA